MYCGVLVIPCCQTNHAIIDHNMDLETIVLSELLGETEHLV